MTIYSSDNSILVQQPDDCAFELRLNPLTSVQPPIFVEDTSSIDMSGSGSVSNKIKGDVKISSSLGNILQSLVDGLFVPQASNKAITLSGDVNGSGTTSINTSLSNTGVTPGTYNSFTVDSKGRIISASTLPFQQVITLTTNGNTGASTFNSNVLNIPDYTIPIASSGVLGGVRIGSGLSINGFGVLSASLGAGMAINGNITGANINGGLLFQEGGLLKQNDMIVVDIVGGGTYINSPSNSFFKMTSIGTEYASGVGSSSSVSIGTQSNAGAKVRSVFIGERSGASTTTVIDSIGLGFGAGSRGNGSSIGTYSRVISIGKYANSDNPFTIDNSVAIGCFAGNTNSNQISLGNCVYINNILDVASSITSAIYTAQPNPLVGIGITTPSAGIDINTQNAYNPIRVRKFYTPTSSTDGNGDVGTICIDDNYIYKKTGAGWTRSAIFTTF